jgi:DNA-binding response OmpR family regulator
MRLRSQLEQPETRQRTNRAKLGAAFTASRSGRMVQRVLVVEDKWLMAQAVCDMLQEHGFEPIGPCPSVAKALRAVEENTLAGAILDVLLIRETSIPVARILMQRGTPFLFLTGSPEDLVPEDLRVVPLVMKPCQPSEAIEVLQRQMT